MALTGAFFTGLSGLDANSRGIDVIGNNIANVNTPAFKSSRAQFTSQFLQTLSAGSPPSSTSGGTNPIQFGLGTRVTGVQTDFSNGGIQATGINTHMAIEGKGFFIVNQNGDEFYTRNGQFSLSSENKLVSPTGAVVQGFGVDDNFNVQTGVLDDLSIPLGSLTIAEPTANTNLEGNLNASGPLSSGGSLHTSRGFHTDAALATDANGTEDLTVIGNDMYIDDGAGGSFLAVEGGTDTVITVSGIEKGGQVLESKSFAFSSNPAVTSTVDASGTSLNDFVSFLDNIIGTDDTSIGGIDLGGSIALNASGEIAITGNEGEVQDLKIETSNFTAAQRTPNGAPAGITQPMVMTKTRDADGESARTSFTVYDSLGTPLSVDVSFVKQASTGGGGTTWEWIAESNDNDAIDRVLGFGTVEFDANGLFLNASNQSFSLTRNNGATSPLTVNMVFDDGTDSITALADSESELAVVRQDGSPIGTLDSFSVGADGIITGTFTNGLARTVGQVGMASFVNDEGLIGVGNSLFETGPNSGNPVIGAPTQFGSGQIVASSLEQSNVDLAEEFVNLINASTGFSASSRVITTSDELIQQLLAIGR
ncbi:MAG: flagellar hook-basal body complex protein [Phycisphaerae bacterium]|jgi:flagellar hook protein FlgE|nr:flagellar hook-basal body complex protein [Phycisphaerae bacterium]